MFPCEAILRLSCVLYFLMVEKVESSFGASPVGVNIWAPFRSALRSSRFVLLYVVSPCVSYLSSRSASRAISLCVSFVRFVLRFARRFCFLYRSCVLSLRFAFPVCPWAMAFDMGRRFVLLVARFAVPCRLSRLVLRLVPCRFASRPASCFACRPCVSCMPLLVSFLRLVLASRLACRPACRFAYRPCVSVRACRLASRHCVPFFSLTPFVIR